MFQQRVFRVVAGVALVAMVAGSSGVVADAWGLAVTSPAYACQNGSGSGGGC